MKKSFLILIICILSLWDYGKLAGQENKTNNWLQWHDSITDYMDKLEKITIQDEQASNSILIQIEDAKKGKNWAEVKELFIKVQERSLAFIEKLKSLKPPQELRYFHEKQIESIDHKNKARYALIGGDQKVFVNELRISSILEIDALEEMKRVFKERGATKLHLQVIDKNISGLRETLNEIDNYSE